MGLLDWLSGDGSAESTGEDESNREGTKIWQVYFVDNDPGGKEPLDYRLVLGPGAETGELGVYRCSPQTHIPEETKLYIFDRGEVVTLGEPYQVCMAQFVQQERYEEITLENWDGYFIDLPDHLTGVTIPERSEWTDDELSELCISLAAREPVQ